MRSRLLLNAAVLGLVLILGLVLVFDPGKEEPSEAIPVSPLAKNTVHSIKIERKDHTPVLLEKRQGIWHLVAPFRSRADESRVQSLLHFLDRPSRTQLKSDAHDLAQFDLDEPKVRLALNGESFTFGGTNPLSSERYVMHDGRIHMLVDTTFHQLMTDPAGFASRHLIDEGRQLVGITLPDAVLRRKGGTWSVVQGDPAKHKIDDVEELVEAWRTAEATAVRTAFDDAPFLGKVSLVFEEAQPVDLEIKARAPELILKLADSGLQYHFSAETAKRLLGVDATIGRDTVPDHGPN